ncbi:uncharacterized protein [Argopecten irradians]|uniref:uncharacterized protein n=1 Tax=Argopecten irradians TaxID=31199 RepID=UPI00371E4AE7
MLSNNTRFNRYKEALAQKKSGQDPNGTLLKEFDQRELHMFNFILEKKKKDSDAKKFGPDWNLETFLTFLKHKYTVMKHGLIISMAAIRSIAGGEPFTKYITRRPF